ncbi:HIT-like domain-containing protein [Schizophyllum amplum]|uniref:HIT-like domain-containing protein n=1 Tax=Schizophyllum amplum TaxID=97359 RepID=A0A550CXJ8_9AGAR|nr:HIT-like domain-containing protein [Auriculariopsis ampla]
MNTPAEIIAKLPATFEAAKATGNLFFFPSTVHTHVDDFGISYEIRLCPALQHKPPLPTPHFDADPEKEKKKPDPFAPPYNEKLLIGELRGEEEEDQYVLLLNKFSVVPYHFLMVTKKFQSQSSPLMPPELAQAYKLLDAAHRTGQNMFAFYNCGDLSGASQPHKHIQFLPVPAEEVSPPIERLAREQQLETIDRPFTISKLPYANHVFRLPSDLAMQSTEQLEDTLCSAFLQLLDLTISTVRHNADYPSGNPSYNVLLTRSHIHVIPRRFENHTLQATGEELSVNALGAAGMLLVKSEPEMEAVKAEGLGKILRSVGLESVHELQVQTGASAQEADT